ncbi:Rad4-domain-containing protein [Aureobasidium pullulans]|uniref:Rad4-domain-containing protein n=1 Tax=Aureobasidium pullulans TaxID=5580 RepID=A0A4S9EKY3_AURPU|nr:Rad4-domain-containing protein [Aureobasidium pullulans]
MAPSTAQSKAQTRAQDRIAAVHGTARTRSKRNAPAPDDDRDVYRSLISEASVPEAVERPLKKPRLGRQRQNQQPDAVHDPAVEPRQASGKPTGRDKQALQGQTSEDEARPQQTIIDSDESEDDDMDWEQVGLDHVESKPSAIQNDNEIGDVSLKISTKQAQKRAIVKRKPATTAEKLLRLEAHEAHLLFLLFHVHVRNAWCNLAENKLKTLLMPDIVSLLHPDQSLIQFGQSQQFMAGLEKAVFVWRHKFNVTASGIRRPNWADGPEGIREQIRAIEDEFAPVEKQDFVKAATTLSGSQDISAQLFCALLRCVGVEARLVCSLQPLPFGTSATKSATPVKGKTTVYAESDKDNTSAGETSAGSASEGSTSSRRRIIAPGRIRRFGKPNLNSGTPTPKSTTPVKKKKRPVRTLSYPVYWVEAFNGAYQKWVPVDAAVTGTVAKPGKLEPPASYEANSMTYVVGFEDDGIARDVTRRYTKAYNAKTRKLRVEITERGEEWWRKALKVFKRTSYRDRDQVEDAELAKKDATEGLPNNVQDFKDHPYYALERHLKRHEVIWPKRASGKVTVGKGALEPVYRRGDVHIVRSADKWYRFGREIKPNEHPLKHVPARVPKGRAQDLDDVDMDEPPATALYAFSQTSLYVPPPVVHGRIPKNAFGNLDIYVPSMVPPGGYHVKHTLAKNAARLIGVDYADAVTGFQFKGRHGTAVTSGVIVAQEYREAVEAVIEGFQYDQENEQARMYSLECLKMWRRFLAGLRIKERLSEYTTSGPKTVKLETVKARMDEAEEAEEDSVEAGGFFPDAGETTAPTAHRFKASESNTSDQEHDIAEQTPRLRRQRKAMVESDPESDEQSEEEYEPSPRRPPVRRRRMVSESPLASDNEHYDQPDQGGGGFVPEDNQDNTDDGGGFLPDADGDESAGGFVPEDDSAQAVDQPSGGPVPETSNMESTSDSGGGFMPEGDDTTLESGGGFLPEADDGGIGGGFMPEEEAHESQPVNLSASEDAQECNEQQDHSRKAVVENQANDTFDPDEADDTFDPDEMEVETRGLPREDSTRVHRQEEEEDEDRGSLLSHDPEDDDAEPEWLLSD